MLSGAGNILPVAMRFFRDDGHFLLCVCMYVGVCVLYIYVGGGVQVYEHEQQPQSLEMAPLIEPGARLGASKHQSSP